MAHVQKRKHGGKTTWRARVRLPDGREYAAQWQAAQMHRPSTAEATESRLRRHVLPTFGHRPIGSLRPSEMRAWVKGLSGKLAAVTLEAC